MASNLAPVYLDDTRVTLQGDPRPQVAKILQASGKRAAEGALVVRLREASGADGHPVALSEVIDREAATTPVYLRVVPKGGAAAGKQPRQGPGFAESQSFADPVHRGGSPRVAEAARPSQEVPPGHRADGGIRTQETSREEGAGLDAASEEE